MQHSDRGQILDYARPSRKPRAIFLKRLCFIVVILVAAILSILTITIGLTVVLIQTFDRPGNRVLGILLGMAILGCGYLCLRITGLINKHYMHAKDRWYSAR